MATSTHMANGSRNDDVGGRDTNRAPGMSYNETTMTMGGSRRVARAPSMYIFVFFYFGMFFVLLLVTNYYLLLQVWVLAPC